MNVEVSGLLEAASSNEVRVGADEDVVINKEYGPLVFAQVRVTAEYDTCEWVIERQHIKSGDWIQVARFPGQFDEEFTDCED